MDACKRTPIFPKLTHRYISKLAQGTLITTCLTRSVMLIKHGTLTKLETEFNMDDQF